MVFGAKFDRPGELWRVLYNTVINTGQATRFIDWTAGWRHWSSRVAVRSREGDEGREEERERERERGIKELDEARVWVRAGEEVAMRM